MCCERLHSHYRCVCFVTQRFWVQLINSLSNSFSLYFQNFLSFISNTSDQSVNLRELYWCRHRRNDWYCQSLLWLAIKWCVSPSCKAAWLCEISLVQSLEKLKYFNYMMFGNQHINWLSTAWSALCWNWVKMDVLSISIQTKVSSVFLSRATKWWTTMFLSLSPYLLKLSLFLFL